MNKIVLECLATIWKAGGIIERLPNGELELKNHSKVPQSCLKASEAIFDDIDTYLKSVEGMSSIEQAVWRMMMYFQGWQLQHENIANFLNSDNAALTLFLDYQVKLAQNGWANIYDDYRQFENVESDELKQLLIKRIVEYGKGAK